MSKAPKSRSRKAVPKGVAAEIAAAEDAARRTAGEAEDIDEFASAGFDLDDLAKADPAVIEFCAGLDQSDTDNAQRLKAHFGGEVTVMAQEGSKSPPFAGWTGSHWDFAAGPQRALATAQRLGGRIALEARFVAPTKKEADAIEAGRVARAKSPGEQTAADHLLIGKADRALEAVEKRKRARRAFGVSSKNKARLEAMLHCLAPHILREADEFNIHDLAFACRSHTIRFDRQVTMRKNPAWDDPDCGAEVLEYLPGPVEVVAWAEPGHRRGDWFTQIVPVDYDPSAQAPKFEAFLAEFQPIAAVRRVVQVSCGIGLLGQTVQHLIFHYGKGANGKSVFLELIARVLAGHAVTLPAESITGTAARSGSGPSPDLARLHGKRWLRVAELPQGEPLRVELIKKLTGGEAFPVRGLFQGFFDFRPQFIAHMSGNGYPKTDETDHGTWRRMVVVKWPVTIAAERQRNFEEVLAEFEPEYPGILNWLIEGARIYLAEGFRLPEETLAETKKYRDEIDPLAAFVAAHCRAVDGAVTTAREAYEGYKAWAAANGAHPISETGFGKKFPNYFEKKEGRVRTYPGLALVDLPGPDDHNPAPPDDSDFPPYQ